MQMLDTFSEEEAMEFLQEDPDPTYDVAMKAAPSIIQNHIVAVKQYLKQNVTKALTGDASVEQVVGATKSLQQPKEKPKEQVAQKKAPSTKGIGRILREADVEEENAEEKNAVENQEDDQHKCIQFCSMLARQATERAEQLAGEKRKADLEARDASLKKKEKGEEQRIKEKKEDLREEKKDIQRQKMRSLKNKEEADKEEEST